MDINFSLATVLSKLAKNHVQVFGKLSKLAASETLRPTSHFNHISSPFRCSLSTCADLFWPYLHAWMHWAAVMWLATGYLQQEHLKLFLLKLLVNVWLLLSAHYNIKEVQHGHSTSRVDSTVKNKEKQPFLSVMWTIAEPSKPRGASSAYH